MDTILTFLAFKVMEAGLAIIVLAVMIALVYVVTLIEIVYNAIYEDMQLHEVDTALPIEDEDEPGIYRIGNHMIRPDDFDDDEPVIINFESKNGNRILSLHNMP